MTVNYSDTGDGYEILEDQQFLRRIEEVVGGISRWDDMRIGLDKWMLRRPTEIPFCHPVRGDLWFAKLASEPLVYLLYRVDQGRRTVTYLDIKVVPQSLSELDPAFDYLS